MNEREVLRRLRDREVKIKYTDVFYKHVFGHFYNVYTVDTYHIILCILHNKRLYIKSHRLQREGNAIECKVIKVQMILN